jgi:hypothetical protein
LIIFNKRYKNNFKCKVTLKTFSKLMRFLIELILFIIKILQRIYYIHSCPLPLKIPFLIMNIFGLLIIVLLSLIFQFDFSKEIYFSIFRKIIYFKNLKIFFLIYKTKQNIINFFIIYYLLLIYHLF